jgi:CubicO group peptidase (beta-lactamase class C family)
MLKTLLVALATLGLALPALAQPLSPLPPQPAGQPWPTQAWDIGPLPVTADRNRIDRLIDEAMPETHPLMGETRAVLVVQRGRLVLARYAPGFGPDSMFISWSLAKSVTQALVGVGAARGLLNPDNPMGHPRWRAGDSRAQITWRQWLQMTDGLNHVELQARTIRDNGAAQMFYDRYRHDTAAYVTGLPLAHQPGTRWNYSTAGLTLVADALTHRVAPGANATDRRARMAAFMRETLFEPIGMRSAMPEFDAAGTFQGGSFMWATAPDWARFGYLYLRDGVWDGRRILPPGWVDFARTPAAGSDADMYGAGWWVTPETGRGSLRRSLIPERNPFDAFSAEGRDGQVVLVVPSQDLVIVRLGILPENSDATWDALGAWIAALAQSFPRPSEPSQTFPLTQGR